MKVRKRVKWDAAASAAENAREVLPRLAEAFFAEGRKVAKKSSDVERLHDFRLSVKRFRYTLEMFQPLYGAALKERLKALHRLQQLLGAMNDCVTTRHILLTTSDAQGVVPRKLLKHLDETEKASKKKALKYWDSKFAPPDEEAKWVRYLRSYAGRARRSAATRTF